MLVTVGSLTACHHHHRNAPLLPPRPPIVCSGIVTTGPSIFTAAPAVIAKALTGVHDRGEQDIMLRIEAKLPGFGGWFLAADTFNVYMKEPSSSLVHNRVVIGFTDSASVCPGAAAIASMGVPIDALELEVWGIIRAL